MNFPLVSIVTVCYNASDSIEQTILSVINQSYANIEYIVIDGGSTDGTVDLIKRYIDRISIFVSEPDNGIYDAMNKAILRSTGSWINFMNAGDEFVNRSVIEKLIPYFSEAKNDVVFGNTLLMRDGIYSKLQKGRIKLNAFPELVHQSTFVRTALMKSHLFNTKYVISADFEFLYSLYVSGNNFCYVDLEVSKYDVSGLSSNHRAELYKEHSEIQGLKISQMKLLLYKIEDNLPIRVVLLLSKLKYFYHSA